MITSWENFGDKWQQYGDKLSLVVHRSLWGALCALCQIYQKILTGIRPLPLPFWQCQNLEKPRNSNPLLIGLFWVQSSINQIQKTFTWTVFFMMVEKTMDTMSICSSCLSMSLILSMSAPDNKFCSILQHLNEDWGAWV